MNFVAPLFLLALAGVGLPVVFHLVRGAKFEVKELATLQWVRPRVSPRRIHRRVTRWPLLIARMLVVAVLALLGARPFFSEARPVAPVKEIVVAVDASGSMARREAVVEKALARVRADQPAETPLRVVRFADTVQPWEEHDIPAAVPGGATSYDRLVQWGIDQAVSAGTIRLVVISDFTRPALEGLRARVWPAGADVRLVSIGRDDAWNAGVTNVTCLTPVASQEVEIEAELAFHGLLPSEPFALRLQTEEGPSLEEKIPAGTSRVRFKWPVKIPAAGTVVRGQVTLHAAGEDELAWDDALTFAFPVVRQRNILLVEGDAGESAFAGECFFANKALRAGSAGTGVRSPFVSTVRPSLGEIEGFHAVVLANVPELSPTEANTLTAFVRAGGGLLVATGDRTKPALATTLRQAGLDLGALEPVAHPTAGIAVYPVASPANPLSDLSADWNNAGFSRSWRLAPPKEAVPWLADEAGEPLLAALPETGPGRVLVLAHPLDGQGNDFPRHSLYVVLLREMAGYLTRFEASAREFPSEPARLGEPRAPGVYPDETSGWIRISATEAESNVTPAPMKEVHAAFGLPETAETTLPASAASALPVTRQRPSEWWPWLAGLLFLLLSAESILAALRPATETKLANPVPRVNV